ncbi:glycosyl transferase [Streptococcus mitis SK564]|uniref:Glycosyl transferase n=1 Tax=Streptococcus mitis SK564 TaxID=585203 RepID=E1LPM5_STRMT|nr:glycosyltransferase family 2 protein [Streptococcus mitis]EFN97768.1 glycosyl transferase [Streptococcus mitis SK564]
MTQELISIVVPIYNVEKYLRPCLNSILSQSYEQFECLLINDGSPDNSADICREYVDKDSRFKYFEKENGGVSSARNLGIERSGGAYITFIDPDDWVESDYLEVLYRALVDEKADLAVSTYKQFNVADNCYYVHSYQRGYEKRVFNQEEFISELPLLERYDYSYGYSTCKLVDRSLLGDFKFNEVTTLSEDMEFWYKVYLFSNKVVYVNRDTYIYRTGNLRIYDSEAIRSDIQQRLNFLTFLGVRGVEKQSYVENFITHLKYRIEEQIKYDLEDTETVRWLKEILFLIDIGSESALRVN